MNDNIIRKPIWLKSHKLGARKTQEISKYLRAYNLNTVCESAKCPNLGECFERGTATFMILGDTCTRNCSFCAVNKNPHKLVEPDPNEPGSIAKVAKKLNLKHIVITTVTRDDLVDGGASQFIKTIDEIRKICDKNVTIEVLISDLQGDFEQVKKIVKASPDVFNHNIETIERLYPLVRPLADYRRSLAVLKYARQIKKTILTKSGIMIGLGENKKEVLSLMDDLRENDVNILTIGQYLQPSKQHLPVFEYIAPEIFSYFEEQGLQRGFKLVESGPLVRSSFHAEKARKIMKRS